MPPQNTRRTLAPSSVRIRTPCGGSAVFCVLGDFHRHRRNPNSISASLSCFASHDPTPALDLPKLLNVLRHLLNYSVSRRNFIRNFIIKCFKLELVCGLVTVAATRQCARSSKPGPTPFVLRRLVVRSTVYPVTPDSIHLPPFSTSSFLLSACLLSTTFSI